jgi:hypothetical protein
MLERQRERAAKAKANGKHGGAKANGAGAGGGGTVAMARQHLRACDKIAGSAPVYDDFALAVFRKIGNHGIAREQRADN